DPDGGFGYLATFSVEEVPAGFLSGVVVGSDVAIGLEGVSVTTDVYSTYTTNTGNYLIEVPVGTYDVTADGYDLGYSTETQTGIIVTEGNITTASFVLDPEDVPNLQAAVADIEEVTLVWDPIAPKKDGGRTLIGDVASNNDYVPNTTMDLEFTMTVYSPDFEWADYASMVFPPDFEPISASALNGIAATIVGQTVYWSGYFYTEDLPEEIDFTVEVTIDVAAAGPYGLDYYVSGDEYGGYPHFFDGAVTIYDDGGTYVPTFNIYRQLGRAFIPIAYGVIGNTYVDEIYPGGDEWCYYVTQILADGTESPASNIRCATPLVRPGTLCSDPLDYGAVNDVAQTDDLVRPFDVRWYEVDVPYTMDVAFSLCNSDFDTQIAVYDSCADFTGSLPDGARGYNDDSDCGNDDYQSLLILELLPGGTYFVAVYGYDDDYGTFELEITQVQVLTISENWSGFSIYIDPTGSTNIADVLDEVADDMIITIRQSPFGLWWPSQNINSIVDISPEVGYKAKMETEPKAEYETVVFGSEVVDKSVTLPVGVSYLPVKVSAPTDASDLVTQLGADLLLIFDIHTNEIIWPEGGLATLTSLVPDNAYLINMINASTYTYPVPVLSPVPSHTPDYSNRTSWNDVVNTGITHFISIAVSAQTEFKAGDVIGVFDTEGTCVGVTEYLEKGTNLFLPVSGNDGYTDTKDGMNEGEAMQFKLYRNGETIELEATFGVQMPNYDGLFMENGISMITGFKLGETSIFENEFAGVNIYPNPSAGVLNISGLEKNAEVTVTNSQGQVVYSGIIGTDTQLDLSKQSKGIYFIRLMNENSVKIEKVVLK
nr:T9SS type A sorting domain-containing protein [Bacteroidota bacterium]